VALTGSEGSRLPMQISDRILDDLLRKVFRRLLASKHQITRRAALRGELVGVLLSWNAHGSAQSQRDRGRAFSCLGEFLWYLSGDNQLVSFVLHQEIT